jgi:hypothetical protein
VAWTTAVAAELAVAVPDWLPALTAATIVEPTSAVPSVYVDPAAPAIGAQLAPVESQRLHWYVNVSGIVPAQLPVETVSVWPTVACPEIVGAEVEEGATAETAAVGALTAEAVPALFDAVTVTRIVLATSLERSWYAEPVAPAIGAQFAPAASQSAHAYE